MAVTELGKFAVMVGASRKELERIRDGNALPDPSTIVTLRRKLGLGQVVEEYVPRRYLLEMQGLKLATYRTKRISIVCEEWTDGSFVCHASDGQHEASKRSSSQQSAAYLAAQALMPVIDEAMLAPLWHPGLVTKGLDSLRLLYANGFVGEVATHILATYSPEQRQQAIAAMHELLNLLPLSNADEVEPRDGDN